MTRDEWLVLAIAAADEAGLSPVQLQKGLFLFSLKREKDVGPHFYRFESHNYGPDATPAEGAFSKDVYTDLDALVAEGLVVKAWQPGDVCSSVSLTETGRAWAKELRAQTRKDTVSYLEEAVAWVKQQSFYDSVHKTPTIRVLG